MFNTLLTKLVFKFAAINYTHTDRAVALDDGFQSLQYLQIIRVADDCFGCSCKACCVDVIEDIQQHLQTFPMTFADRFIVCHLTGKQMQAIIHNQSSLLVLNTTIRKHTVLSII